MTECISAANFILDATQAGDFEMAHAATEIYATPAQALVLSATNEVEIRCGCQYIRMEAAEAEGLLAQLSEAISAAKANGPQTAQVTA